jgi:hypothetical protein
MKWEKPFRIYLFVFKASKMLKRVVLKNFILYSNVGCTNSVKKAPPLCTLRSDVLSVCFVFLSPKYSNSSLPVDLGGGGRSGSRSKADVNINIYAILTLWFGIIR